MNVDFDQTDYVMKEYGPLLCPECKESLEVLGAKVTARLNKGKKPRIKDMIKLVGALCPSCHEKVYTKKFGVRG